MVNKEIKEWIEITLISIVVLVLIGGSSYYIGFDDGFEDGKDKATKDVTYFYLNWWEGESWLYYEDFPCVMVHKINNSEFWYDQRDLDDEFRALMLWSKLESDIDTFGYCREQIK